MRKKDVFSMITLGKPSIPSVVNAAPAPGMDDDDLSKLAILSLKTFQTPIEIEKKKKIRKRGEIK